MCVNNERKRKTDSHHAEKDEAQHRTKYRSKNVDHEEDIQDDEKSGTFSISETKAAQMMDMTKTVVSALKATARANHTRNGGGGRRSIMD